MTLARYVKGGLTKCFCARFVYTADIIFTTSASRTSCWQIRNPRAQFAGFQFGHIDYSIYKQKWLQIYAMTEVPDAMLTNTVSVECLKCGSRYTAYQHPLGYIC